MMATRTRTRMTRLEMEAVSARWIAELRALYSSRQASLWSKISKPPTSFQAWRANEILVQVNREVRFLTRLSTEWSKDSTRATYQAGATYAADRIVDADDVNFGNRIHTRAVSVLAEQTAQDLALANASIGRNVRRYVRLTQQKLIEDMNVSRVIAQGLIEGEPRRSTSSELLRQFQNQMGNQQFITINGRNFEPSYYSELVARTRTREATTQGAINSTLENGQDLMRVSVHNHPQNDPCLEHQGKTYSLTGATRGFPVLGARPPFHPNCRHVMTPVSETALRTRGQFDEMSTFSRSSQFATTRENFADRNFETELPDSSVKGPSTRAAIARARRREKARAKRRAEIKRLPQEVAA